MLKDGVNLQAVIDAYRTNVPDGNAALHGVAMAVNSSNDRQVHILSGWDSIEVYLFQLCNPLIVLICGA